MWYVQTAIERFMLELLACECDGYARDSTKVEEEVRLLYELLDKIIVEVVDE
jgi:hypothetical protein